MPAAKRILCIDVGGTGLKAAVISPAGKYLVKRVRVKTPKRRRPADIVKALTGLAGPMGSFDHVTIGFPGMIRDGKVVTAPAFGSDDWKGYDLVRAMQKTLARPVKLLNDADVQGLAAIKGRGLELVCTLGTGFGTAWFRDGELMPHMEIGLSPAAHDLIYDAYIGDAAYKKIGNRKWNHRLKKMLPVLHRMLNYDHIYIGGGNTRHINFTLPPNAKIVSKNAGIKGGAGLWHRPGSHKAKA